MNSEARKSDDFNEENKPVPTQREPEEKEDSLETERAKILFDELPPRTRRELVSSVLSIQQRIGPAPNPLFAKANEGHLDKFLDNMRRGEDQAHELRKSNRVYYLIFFWSAVLVLGGAVHLLLPTHPEFLDTILKILLGFAGGVGAGYGLKSRTGRD